MKSRFFLHPAILFITLSIIVVILSWVGSIYRWEGVRNLLEAENTRWLMLNMSSNFLTHPLFSIVFIGAIGIGTVFHSGLYSTCIRRWSSHTKLTQKERRALFTAGIGLLLYFGILAVILFNTTGLLHNILGTWSDSPFSHSVVLLISTGFTFSGVLFGFATENYLSGEDFFQGMVYGLRRSAPFFVFFFFFSVFFLLVTRSGILSFLSLSDDAITYAYYGCIGLFTLLIYLPHSRK